MHGVLSLRFDIDAYIRTFWEVRLGICVESWVEQKSYPNATQVPKSFSKN